MRVHALALSFLALTCIACAPPRANPRLTSLTADNGAARQDLQIEYDASGFPERIEKEISDITLVTELTWSSGRLEELVTEAGDNTITTTFSFDGDLLVRAESDGRECELAYDRGRLTSMQIRDGDDVQELEFEYDDDGRLERFNGGVFGETEIDLDDGRPASLTFAGNVEVDAEYDDDGRLEVLDTMTYSYDDAGRVDEIVDAASTFVWDLDYDDGDAAGLDVTPFIMGLSLPLWDLRGQPHSTPDARTQAARFVTDLYW